MAVSAIEAAHGLLDVYVVAHADAAVDATVLPLVRDTDGDFAKAYGVDGAAAFVVRPDGHLGYVGAAESAALVAHLQRTFR